MTARATETDSPTADAQTVVPSSPTRRTTESRVEPTATFAAAFRPITATLTARADITGTAVHDAEASATRASLAPEPSETAEAAAPVTESATPLPAVFAHLIATPTAFGAVGDVEGPECTVVEGWQPYEVQDGDSLLALALASGSSLIEVREGNCFGPVTGIIVGETIALPQLPASPIDPARTLFPISDAAFQVAGCESARAVITEPAPLTELQGIFALRGRALIPDGGLYRISVKPAWSPDYHLLVQVNQAVDNDLIALINTEVFGPGLQRLRLELVGSGGNSVTDNICEIPVVFKGTESTKDS